ncbi:elongation factor Ts, mitochondrial [Brevipalpus obovatus]|uniref:elongation factor Ts, mitochondrial n=1 Tax=Brevipalpus obovatus TaxID=246614 RepID=UPI003D9F4741
MRLSNLMSTSCQLWSRFSVGKQISFRIVIVILVIMRNILWTSLPLVPRANSFRLLSTAASSNLAKLRKRTGFAFTLCKKALELNQNDLEQAELWLKEESIKHGYQKAAQIKDRRAVQGLIGVHLDQQLGRGCLLELNCETDFVARNDKFRELAAHITKDLGNAMQVRSPQEPIKKNFISRYTIRGENLEAFNDKISGAITQLGENIKLARAMLVQNEPRREDIIMFGHAHASGDTIPDVDGIKLGKYGAIVACRQLTPEEMAKVQERQSAAAAAADAMIKESHKPKSEQQAGKDVHEGETRQLTDEEVDDRVGEEDDDFEEPSYAELTTDGVGRILCQQVIGLNPAHLRKSEQLLAKEKELMDQGYKIPEETDCLLEQKIIINDSLTVADFAANHGFEVVDFVRLECGEKLEE